MAQNPYSNPIMQGKPGLNGPALPGGSPGEYTGGVTQRPLTPKPRMTLEQSDMMRNANKNPYSPNNGNPRGANNMPNPRGRMTPVMNPSMRRMEQTPEGPYTDPPLPRVNPDSYRNNPQDAPVYPGQGQSGFRSYERDNRMQGGGGGESYQDYLNNFGGSISGQPATEEEWRRMQQDPRAQPGYQGGGQGNDANYRRLQELYNQFGSRFPALGGQGYQRGPSQGYMGGQQPYSGRYRPPMMNGQGNWMDYGGYNYNLPNAFGSYPGYGQGNPNSPYYDEGYGSYYGLPPGGG